MDWPKAKRPGVLYSKVEAMFGQREFEIVWTPPYFPKLQPIGPIWGAAKQRALGMYLASRSLLGTRLHFRMGF